MESPKPDELELPYMRAWGRGVHWFGYAVVLCIPAAGIPIGLQRFLPTVPTSVELVIFGILSAPVLVCTAFGIWHTGRMFLMVLRGGRPRFW